MNGRPEMIELHPASACCMQSHETTRPNASKCCMFQCVHVCSSNYDLLRSSLSEPPHQVRFPSGRSPLRGLEFFLKSTVPLSWRLQGSCPRQGNGAQRNPRPTREQVDYKVTFLVKDGTLGSYWTCNKPSFGRPLFQLRNPWTLRAAKERRQKRWSENV